LELSGRRVLVTGGAGFIGSHLIESLLRLGAHVVCIDNLDEDFYPGKEKNIRRFLGRSPNFEFLRGDILDFDVVLSAMRNCEIIFHEAAQAGIRYCNERPEKANRVNIGGTLNILMATKKLKEEQEQEAVSTAGKGTKTFKRVIYASSSSVYGDPIALPIDEEHPTNPNSPYGVSKLAGEHYCRVFSKIYGLDVVCLRYFSVYGPRGRPDQVIHAFAKKLKMRERPVIYGDGSQSRDFTFVEDVVRATILAAGAEDAPGEVLNIGYGSAITINELYEKLSEALNGLARRNGEEVSNEIAPIHAETSKGDFPHTEANNEKARKVLGWEPKVSLDEGLKIFLDWFMGQDENF
jgi:UDP-glucose 4-epimerase